MGSRVGGKLSDFFLFSSLLRLLTLPGDQRVIRCESRDWFVQGMLMSSAFSIGGPASVALLRRVHMIRALSRYPSRGGQTTAETEAGSGLMVDVERHAVGETVSGELDSKIDSVVGAAPDFGDRGSPSLQFDPSVPRAQIGVDGD